MFDWAGKSYRACNLQLNNKLHNHLSHCTVPVTQTGRACSWWPPPAPQPADAGKLFSCLIEAKTLWMTCFTWHASESGRQPWPVHLRPALLDHSLSLSLSGSLCVWSNVTSWGNTQHAVISALLPAECFRFTSVTVRVLSCAVFFLIYIQVAELKVLGALVIGLVCRFCIIF